MTPRKLGLGVVPFRVIQHREVVEGLGHIGVLRSQRLLPYSERAFSQWESGIELPLAVEPFDFIVELLSREPERNADALEKTRREFVGREGAGPSLAPARAPLRSASCERC